MCLLSCLLLENKVSRISSRTLSCEVAYANSEFCTPCIKRQSGSHGELGTSEVSHAIVVRQEGTDGFEIFRWNGDHSTELNCALYKQSTRDRDMYVYLLTEVHVYTDVTRRPDLQIC